jgi:pSer/pThr/pTyr-binding forkhead associated (FHA) protein
MIELRVLSGAKRGSVLEGESLPLTLGRAATDHFRLEDAGVWDKHAHFERAEGGEITLTARKDALVTINGTKVRQTTLKSGDLLEFGGTKLRFGLKPAKQPPLQTREFFTWSLLLLVTVVQGIIVFWSVTW